MDINREHNGKIILIPGEYYELGYAKEYYMYAGVFESIEDVPKTSCLYVIGNKLYKRKLNMDYINKMKVTKKKNVVKPEGRMLDVTIKDDDDELMVIIKKLLELNNITIDKFKEMFDDVSEMNNMRRAIECANNGSLSWKRFRQMLDKLGLKYKLTIYAKEDDFDTNEDPLEPLYNYLNSLDDNYKVL